MNPRATDRLPLLLALVLCACGDDGTTDDGGTPETSDGPTTTGDTTPGDSTGGETSNVTAEGSADGASNPGGGGDCSDQMILDLSLVGGSVSTGEVVNTADGRGWSSTIDATAGGITEAPDNPWIYLRFAEQGLERVDLDDLQALGSTDWDIAAKRFGIRINSGSSGPSAVAAADFEGSTYEDLTAVPDGATFTPDLYYTDDCTLLDDGSGQGAPRYRLTPWWFYAGCVGTTGIPFVLELADGRHVKLVIDAYYQSGQDACNSDGAMGTGSANFSWRWAYLE